MAKSIDVAVAQGTSFLRWARNRPARILPNGCVGAVYNGLVMPVYKKRFDSLSIDINDNGCDPDGCPFWTPTEPFRFSDDTDKPGESEGLTWYIETNAFGHYVLFDGDEDTLNNVLGRFAARGVAVKRHGSSHRPADNGYHYGWFIRLEFDGAREEAEKLVSDALSKIRTDDGTADANSASLIFCLPPAILGEAIREGMLRQDASALVNWLGRIAETARLDIDRVKLELQEEIDEATSDAKALQASLTETKRAAALEKSRAENSINELKLSIEAIRKRLDQSNRDVSNAAELETKIAKLEVEVADRDDIYREWIESDKKCALLASALERTRKDSQDLFKTLQTCLQSRATQNRPSDRMRAIVKIGLGLLTEIDVHADAAETIFGSFYNPEPLFKVLQCLNRGEAMPVIRIRAASDWFEVDKHINTGQSDMGRVYYKIQESNRLFVVIHCKKDNAEQRRFFEKLCDPNFMRDLSF